jgi:RNA polymerase sigma-70 factor (ECF subfamily)
MAIDYAMSVPGQRRAAPDVDLPAALEAARGGSEDGFCVVYRAVQPALLRYVATIVGQDAEDVTAEAWLQIARDIRGFKGDLDNFRGWAATIARHRALDHLRRAKARPVSGAVIDPDFELPATDDPAALAIAQVDGDTALNLIATLPPDQAEAVRLRVLLGLSAEDAAKVLGKRPGAVRTNTHRGLKALAAKLQQPAKNFPPGVTSTRPDALKGM